MEIYTKESIINKLIEIRNRGWIPNARHGNDAGVGNTLEDLLGLKENNLPIPNAAEWELKCQRAKTQSLTTLFHLEPSPRTLKLVPQLLLPCYGWQHQEAGKKHSIDEKSFRQTLNAVSRTDRGFGIQLDFQNKKIVISFDYQFVTEKHQNWLELVKQNIGTQELNPQPYWGFEDFFHKAGTKLTNCFFITAEEKKEDGKSFFHYKNILMLQHLSLDKLINSISQGDIYIDFDARTGHNHGTKFRIKQKAIPDLYDQVNPI